MCARHTTQLKIRDILIHSMRTAANIYYIQCTSNHIFRSETISSTHGHLDDPVYK